MFERESKVSKMREGTCGRKSTHRTHTGIERAAGVVENSGELASEITASFSKFVFAFTDIYWLNVACRIFDGIIFSEFVRAMRNGRHRIRFRPYSDTSFCGVKPVVL